jgi:hypothetical protein
VRAFQQYQECNQIPYNFENEIDLNVYSGKNSSIFNNFSTVGGAGSTWPVYHIIEK